MSSRNARARAPLAIRRMDAYAIALPLVKPMYMAGVHLTAAENLVVRVEARNGCVGWGEAASAPTMTGDTPRSMLSAVQRARPRLIGADAFDHARIVRALNAMPRRSTGANAAIDMALLDLVGRHLEVSMTELLGGRVRDAVRGIWLLGNPTVDGDIAEALEKRRQGVTFFKLKVGTKSPAEDVAAALALRRALGPTATICADANMGMTVRSAAAFLRGAARARIAFLEQPLAYGAVRPMARLARMTRVPLGADESINGTAAILAHYRAGAVGGIALKNIKLGGITATVQAAAVCEALGLKVNLSAKIAESSLAAAALLHMCAVIGDAEWGVSVTNQYIAADIVRKPIVPRRGVFSVPTGPGLGVDVDERAVARYRTRSV